MALDRMMMIGQLVFRLSYIHRLEKDKRDEVVKRKKRVFCINWIESTMP